MRKGFAANGILVFVAALLTLAAPLASAQDQQQGQPAAKTPYTLAEYNAFQACASQTDSQARIQSCDDFASKFPNSVLLPLVYQTDYQAYNQLKNYPKTIEAADKFLAVPDDKLTVIPGVTKEKLVGDRLQAEYIRAVAFNQSFNEKDPNAQDELTKARQAALDGLKVLGELPKPANMTDDQFAQQKKAPEILFNYTAGSAAFQLKNYKDAIDSFNAVLADKSDDAATYFRLGVAYLQMAAQQAPNAPATPAAQPNGTPSANPTMPPGATPDPAAQQLNDLYMNGFWALARSIALKGPGEAQMQSYLRAQMFNYEQPACGTLLDQQITELIQLAGTATTRPATYSIPSAADLGKVLQASNLLLILSDLQTGGDKGKMTWLAVCGQEIPDVVGKIIDVTPGTDSIDFKVFTAATGEEIQAGTTANLNVTVWTAPHAGAAAATPAAAAATQTQMPAPVQPEAARLLKGDAIKFTGTLVSYDAQPFLVHFDKCKVDPKFIPPEKGGAKRRPRRPGRR